MRITKKYAGKSCIGKQIYQPCEGFQNNLDAIQEAEKELDGLEKIFLKKIQSKSMLNSPSNSNLLDLQKKRSPSNRIQQREIDLDEESRVLRAEEQQDIFLTGKDDGKFFLPFPAKSTEAKRPSFRRNMSAPVFATFQSDFRDPLNQDDLYLFSSQMERPYPTAGQQSSGKSISSFAAKKRCHSVMALMDFEKLVSDETAAGEKPRLVLFLFSNSTICLGDLFYEFVTMIGSHSSQKQSRTNYSSQLASHAEHGSSSSGDNLTDPLRSQERISEIQPSFPEILPEPHENFDDQCIIVNQSSLSVAPDETTDESENFF